MGRSPYWRATYNIQSYIPFGKHTDLLLGAQSGFSVGYTGKCDE